MRAVNPATGEVIRDYAEDGADGVGRKLAKAGEAFAAWSRTSFGERAERMHGAAAILRERRDAYARMMTAEMGKTLAASEAEVEKCAWVCDFYAEHAAQLLAPEPRPTDATESYVRFDPLGAVLAVMPWNFPFWQVFRFAAPGAHGRATSGSSSTPRTCPGCALAIEEVFRRAGFPEGAFQTLLIGSRARSTAVIAHPAVRGGDAHRQRAGRARRRGRRPATPLKKTVLELGGSDPFIVLADADPWRRAARRRGRALHQQRPVLHRRQALHRRGAGRRRVRGGLRRAACARSGSATRWTAPPTSARSRARTCVDDLDAQVTPHAWPPGARLLLRRTRGCRARAASTRRPCSPTSRRACPPSTRRPSARWRAVTRARDADARGRAGQPLALRPGRQRLDRRPRARPGARRASIEAGAVFVNGMVKSDPRLPFGGVKDSGYGRELAAFGIREFVNVKTVWTR